MGASASARENPKGRLIAFRKEIGNPDVSFKGTRVLENLVVR